MCVHRYGWLFGRLGTTMGFLLGGGLLSHFLMLFWALTLGQPYGEMLEAQSHGDGTQVWLALQ
jgi:hypothetical protein